MITISKINIKFTVVSDENTITGKRSSIFNNETFTYTEDDNTLVKFNIKKEILERENNDILIKYDLKKEKASIFLKELNKYIYPNIIIKDKDIGNSNVNIVFCI